jgi:hypothetical protein
MRYFSSWACFIITFATEFQELVNWAGKDTVHFRRAPAGGDGQTDEVSGTEATMSGGEAPSDEGATTLAGGIETTVAIEVNAH